MSHNQTIEHVHQPSMSQLSWAIPLTFAQLAPLFHHEPAASSWDFKAFFSTSIDDRAPQQLFSFEGTAGATYHIVSESHRDPYLLQLIDEQGEIIALDDQSGPIGTDHIGFIAPYDGLYYLDASWQRGFTDAAQYASISVYEDLDTKPPLFAAAIPSVEAFSPANLSTGVPVNSDIGLIFSEMIQRGSGFISIRNATHTLIESFHVATSPNISISGRTFTINPTNDLLSDSQYVVSIDAGAISDLVGNGNAQIAPYGFTTAAISPVLPPVERVFDWGESHYPELFSDRPESIDIFGYHARIYSNGNAIGERNNAIYFYDGGTDGTGDIVLVGATADLLSQAVSAGF